MIRNAAGAAVNRIEYSVTGDANVTRSLDRNAELQVTLAKHDYKPGEQVEIAIRAPYAGSGLITIERDKVYAHAWFHADTTSSIQHITVPAGFEGNGYINVQYIRDPSSDEIFMAAELRRRAVLGEPRRAPQRGVGRCAGAREARRHGELQCIRRSLQRSWCSRSTRASCRSRATSSAIR